MHVSEMPDVGDRLRAIGVDAAEVLREAEEPDYIMWAFVAHRGTMPQNLESLDQPDLRHAIEQRMTDWHPTLRRLMSDTDPRTIQAFDFSAAAAVKPWSSTNVTLLGDALHFMPPVGGMGGNAALHDASLLRSALVSVKNGESALLAALHGYEQAMIAHGFGAVRASLLYTRLAISRSHLLRAVARTFFRVCGSVPPLRRAVFQDDARDSLTS
jgi:2-polyprenyl-6-methoxyphenol hydroxylase-like FAD-dependent oxidoreductase